MKERIKRIRDDCGSIIQMNIDETNKMLADYREEYVKMMMEVKKKDDLRKKREELERKFRKRSSAFNDYYKLKSEDVVEGKRMGGGGESSIYSGVWKRDACVVIRKTEKRKLLIKNKNLSKRLKSRRKEEIKVSNRSKKRDEKSENKKQRKLERLKLKIKDFESKIKENEKLLSEIEEDKQQDICIGKIDKARIEPKLIQEFSNPNIVKIYGYLVGKETIDIVMERMPMDLNQYVFSAVFSKKKKKLSLKFDDKIHILTKVANGVSYLHEIKNIVHADIKSSNILVSRDLRSIKITDFGLSKKCIGGRKSVFKTMNLAFSACYVPPEYLEIIVEILESNGDKKFIEKSKRGDIFSLGVLFYFVMEESKYPFKVCDNKMDAISAARRKEIGDFPKTVEMDTKGKYFRNCPKEIKELIMNMISTIPEHRMKIKKVLNVLHNFLESDTFEKLVPNPKYDYMKKKKKKRKWKKKEIFKRKSEIIPDKKSSNIVNSIRIRKGSNENEGIIQFVGYANSASSSDKSDDSENEDLNGSSDLEILSDKSEKSLSEEDTDESEDSEKFSTSDSDSEILSDDSEKFSGNSDSDNNINILKRGREGRKVFFSNF